MSIGGFQFVLESPGLSLHLLTFWSSVSISTILASLTGCVNEMPYEDLSEE